MRSDMSFPPTKRSNHMIMNILSFFLTVLLLAGCISQTTENTKTAEQDQIKSQTAETGSEGQTDRQITAVHVDMADQKIVATVTGNQKLVYTSIKQSFPFGIAVYLPEAKISPEDRKSVV